MTVWVVLERRAGECRLVGAYATEDLAQLATDGSGGGWVAEVIPCDVLDEAP